MIKEKINKIVNELYEDAYKAGFLEEIDKIRGGSIIIKSQEKRDELKRELESLLSRDS